jgi:hypothetical protein
MSCEIKDLIQKIYYLQNENIPHIFNLYFSGKRINNLTNIVIIVAIIDDICHDEYTINIKYPSRLNIINNGEELIDDVLWFKEEYLNPTIVTNSLLYHIPGINRLEKLIYNKLVIVSDSLKFNSII